MKIWGWRGFAHFEDVVNFSSLKLGREGGVREGRGGGSSWFAKPALPTPISAPPTQACKAAGIRDRSRSPAPRPSAARRPASQPPINKPPPPPRAGDAPRLQPRPPAWPPPPRWREPPPDGPPPRLVPRPPDTPPPSGLTAKISARAVAWSSGGSGAAASTEPSARDPALLEASSKWVPAPPPPPVHPKPKPPAPNPKSYWRAGSQRWGARGSTSNPNVKWHSLRARARKEGWLKDRSRAHKLLHFRNTAF